MANHIANLTQTLHILDPHALTGLATLVRDVRIRGGTVWLAGNGGSMATAQHWACDLSKAAGVRAQALGSNPAVLMAWANDNDYASALGSELSRLARLGDCLICLSCSGASPNIHWAMREAKARRMSTALITSVLCPSDPAWDLLFRVPAEDYGVIEDCHSIIGHWLTKELAQ